MGYCMSRESQIHLDGVCPEELIVYRSECQINLWMVPYVVFRSAIKRYGYATDLTDKHMWSIAGEIMLDADEMYNNPKSSFALAYLDEHFRSQDKRHSVQKLLRLGWLCCLHRSLEEQQNELWNLINPSMAETITKQDVFDFMSTLTRFTVTINKTMLITDEESVQEILNSVAYLDQAAEKLEAFMQKTSENIPRRINKVDCIEIFQKNGFFRSYTLREQIVGKRMAPQKQKTQKELQSVIPTPSPPKRGPNFGQKEQASDDLIEFSVDSNFESENVGPTEKVGPFSPASPQTSPSAAQKKKATKKGKKIKLIKPLPMETV